MSAVAYDIEKDLAAKGWYKSPREASTYRLEEKTFLSIENHIPMRIFCTEDFCVESDKPVQITIHFEDGCFIAENEKLNIYVTGESQVDAVGEFISQLVYFYNYYRNLSYEEVTGVAEAVKIVFDEHFRESMGLVA